MEIKLTNTSDEVGAEGSGPLAVGHSSHSFLDTSKKSRSPVDHDDSVHFAASCRDTSRTSGDEQSTRDTAGHLASNK